LFFSIALWSCSKNDKKIPNTIVTVIDPVIDLKNPVFATDAVSQHFNNLIHCSLLEIDPEFKIKPELALSVRKINKLEYEFFLDFNRKFSDGSQINKEDILKAIDFYRYNKKSPHYKIFSNIKNVQIKKNILYLKLNKLDPYFLYNLYLLKIFKENSDSTIIGCGRYIVASKNFSQIKLKKNIYWFGSKDFQKVDELIFYIVREEITRIQLLMQKKIDVLQNAVSLSAIRELEKKYKIYNFPGINVSYLAFNLKNKFLKEKKVRQALSMAIDYSSVQRFWLKDFAQITNSLLSPWHEGYSYENDFFYKHDLVTAEKILDNLNFKKNKFGIRFSLVFKTTTEKTALEIARLIQESFKKIGVQVLIKPLELGTFFSDINHGNFDLYTSRWVGISNPGILVTLFHSKEIGRLNRGFYVNLEFDKIANQFLNEDNIENRIILIKKMEEILREDLPYIYLWRWNNVWIYDKDIIIPKKLYPNGAFLNLTAIEFK
jgi:peptide/nickel transport system substrate-binding protein